MSVKNVESRWSVSFCDSSLESQGFFLALFYVESFRFEHAMTEQTQFPAPVCQPFGRRYLYLFAPPFHPKLQAFLQLKNAPSDNPKISVLLEFQQLRPESLSPGFFQAVLGDPFGTSLNLVHHASVVRADVTVSRLRASVLLQSLPPTFTLG